MLRLLAVSVLVMPSAAHASSIMALAPAGSGPTPSIVELEAGSTSSFANLGNAFESEAIAYVSPSIIAMGEAPAEQQVSSAGDEPRWRSEPLPMVIRGGLVGSAFASPQPAETVEEDEGAEASSGLDPVEEAEAFEEGEEFEE